MSQRMKRLLPLVMFLMTGALVAPAANADLTHRLSTSTQLTVEGAFTSGYERCKPRDLG